MPGGGFPGTALFEGAYKCAGDDYDYKTNERWEKCRDFYKDEKFHIMFRPVAKNELLRKCHELLGDYKREESEYNVADNRRRKKKIMLVDDSALLLRSMKSMLEKHYDICLAKSGL